MWKSNQNLAIVLHALPPVSIRVDRLLLYSRNQIVKNIFSETRQDKKNLEQQSL
jgi:hypothetical protein